MENKLTVATVSGSYTEADLCYKSTWQYIAIFISVQSHKRTLTDFIYMFSVSVCPFKVWVHLNFISHLDVLAASSVCLVICQHRSNKLERKFWVYLFWLNLSAEIINIMWCDVFRLLRSDTTSTSAVFTFYANYRCHQMGLCLLCSWEETRRPHPSSCIHDTVGRNNQKVLSSRVVTCFADVFRNGRVVLAHTGPK